MNTNRSLFSFPIDFPKSFKKIKFMVVKQITDSRIWYGEWMCNRDRRESEPSPPVVQHIPPTSPGFTPMSDPVSFFIQIARIGINT